MDRLSLWLVVVLSLSQPVVSPGVQRSAPSQDRAPDCRLDEVQLGEPDLPPRTRIVIERFSTDGTDLGTGSRQGRAKHQRLARRMLSSIPEELSSELSRAVARAGDATDASALTLRGRFLAIDPGSYESRRDDKRGQPTSVVVSGSLEAGDGRVLGTFEHRVNDDRDWGTLRARLDSVTSILADDLVGFVSSWRAGDHSVSCSTRRIGVAVQASADAGIEPDYRATITVFKNPDSPDPIGQQEVATKIASVLSGQGLALGSPAEAQLSLLFDFGTTIEDHRGRPSYKHRLSMSAVETESLTSERPRVVWRGDVELIDSREPNPARPLEILDLMIVAGLEWFGRDTSGRWQRDYIDFNDPRAEDLRRSWRQLTAP